MNNREVNDELLINEAVQGVLCGDLDAFERLIRRFEGPLQAWLAVQSPPGVDVGEIAQRSFVAAYLRIADFKPGTSFSNWLFTIAKYQLKTETTRLRRVADFRARYAPEFLQRELDRRSSEPPELQVARLEHLKVCLETLREDVRRFIDWRYNEEITLEEMAVRSDRSVAAVKKQLWLLRKKLQKCVESRLTVAEGGVL